jgi:UDP-MurNAc hydroxylase
LLVEAGADRLVIDPWLTGSCYWRSWWHLPPARADLVNPRTISAVYLTHEHPDHFHLPSLRRFPREVRILVPRFPVDRYPP